MWNHLVFFLTNTPTNNLSEELSRHAAWDIAMYAPAAKELKRKRCFCFKCSHFAYM